jgi:hypothetical protein
MEDRCADPLDRAGVTETFQRELAIKQIKDDASKPGMKAIGRCYWCEEKLPNQKIFCDADCSADFARNKLNKANHV